MNTLSEWKRKHGISDEAYNDLCLLWGIHEHPESSSVDGKSEAYSQTKVMLAESYAGTTLFRNNVGAAQDKTGRIIRYGLCNESKKMNEKMKSSDLIGVRPVTITREMVGTVIGQFVAIEVKKPGWSFEGDEHETAQLRFGGMVAANGGFFKFSNGDEYEA